MTLFTFHHVILCILFQTFFVNVTAEGNQTVECGPGWKQHKDTCFTVVPIEQTWDMAQELCKSSQFGGRLAEIKTLELKLFLDVYLGRTYENAFPNELFWLGATDKHVDGHWVWSSSNSTVLPILWSEQATPLGNILFNCLILGRNTMNKFKDESCSSKHYFICEKSLTDVLSTDVPTTVGIFGGNQNGGNINPNQQTTAPDIDVNHELPVFVG